MPRSFTKKNVVLFELITTILNGRLRTKWTTTVAVVDVYIGCYTSSPPICTSHSASVVTNKAPSDFGDIIVCLATHTRYGVGYFFKVINLGMSSLLFSFFGRFVMETIDTR